MSMKPEPLIEQALEDTLSKAEWQALLNDPAARQELERQLGMDALLRVALEDDSPLHAAIVASLNSARSSDLMRDIEKATTGTRRPGRRQKRRHWITASLPHWSTAAAAVLIGLLSGVVALPEVILWLDLGPVIAQRTGKPVIIHGHVIADVVQPKPAAAPVIVAASPAATSPTATSPNLEAPGPTPAPPEPPKAEAAPTAMPHTVAMTETEAPAPAPVMPSEAPPAPASTPDAPATVTSPPPPAMALASRSAEEMPTAPSLPDASGKIDFEKHVLPILERSCFECHSSKMKKPKGGIRLDDLELIRDKSRSDNLVLPHKADKSTLVKSISLKPDDDGIMPPPKAGKPLNAEEVALIRRWVEDGADFGAWTSMRAKDVTISTQNEAVNASAPQAVAARIDALIEQDLAKHGQEPRPLANDATWLRRVYLDLVGRIPTSDEARRFLFAKEGNKRARLIDELLASNGHVSHMFNYWCDLLRAKDNLAEVYRAIFIWPGSSSRCATTHPSMSGRVSF